MRRVVRLSVAVAAISAPLCPALAQNGQWQVEVAPAQCRLSRSIGGAQPSAISLQTTPGSDSYQLTLAGPALRGLIGMQLEPAELVFAESIKIKVLARATRLDGALATAVRMGGIGPELLNGLAGGSTIAVRRGGRESSPLAFANSAKGVVALRRCNADQLIEWGADPAQFQPGGATPVARIPRDDWVPNGDLLRIGTDRPNFEAQFKVGITVDGSVDTCDALETGGSSNVAKIACKAVSGRTLFAPARGSNGDTVRGVATFSIQLIRRPNS